MSETEVFTTEDLRNRMFEVLKKRGLIDVLKVRRHHYHWCDTKRRRDGRRVNN